jgi:glycosyltransferase involved in cell wall biosynthesis
VPPFADGPSEVLNLPQGIDDGHVPRTTQVRVLLVADKRSPTTWGWVESIRSAGVVVLGLDGQPWPEHRTFPANDKGARERARRWFHSLSVATPRRLKAVQRCKRALGPLSARLKGHRLRRVIAMAEPDVVHALRIPYEAMVARAACTQSIPLTVSIWGNDLTLHASKSRIVRCATRKVLNRADLLFADCQRDIDMAQKWGLRPNISTAVLPGGGGIRLDRLAWARSTPDPRPADLWESDNQLIINARGCREYVRNDVLLEALSLLAADLSPSVRIVFVDAIQDKTLRRAVESHPLADRTIVTGKYSPTEILSLFSRTEIYVSITAHDGTPNSLLEAMAAGAIPVCGDLPSIREWISHGSNGFLATIDDPQAVAMSLQLALDLSATDRAAIRTMNARIIAARAEQDSTGRHAAEKYLRLGQRAVEDRP